MGTHGVHVAEFYAKLLDYGGKVAKKRKTKRKGEDSPKKKVRVDEAKPRGMTKKELYQCANSANGMRVLGELIASEFFDVHVVDRTAEFSTAGSKTTVTTEGLYYFCDRGALPSAKTGGIVLARVGSNRKDKIEFFPENAVKYVRAGETLSGRKHATEQSAAACEEIPADDATERAQ